MDSSQTVGLMLVGLSAALLASHWQQRGPRSERLPVSRQRYLFLRRQLRRRTVASSLVGLVGLAMVAFDRVSHTPLSITVYLVGLLVAACCILGLGIIDILATKRFRQREQFEQLAEELQRAHARLPPP